MAKYFLKISIRDPLISLTKETLNQLKHLLSGAFHCLVLFHGSGLFPINFFKEPGVENVEDE